MAVFHNGRVLALGVSSGYIISDYGGIDVIGGHGGGEEGGHGDVIRWGTAVDAGVRRVTGFTQGDNAEVGVGAAGAAGCDGIAYIQNGKAGGAAELEAFSGQRPPDAGDLDGAVGVVKMLQPVGGQICLAGAQRKSGFNQLPVHSDVAGSAIAGDVVFGR